MIPSDEHEDEEAEPQAENRESPQIPHVCFQDRQKEKFFILPLFPRATANIWFSSQQYYLLSQAGALEASAEQREAENDGLKRELEVLKPELQLIKTEVICAALISCCLFCFSSIVSVSGSGSEVRDRAESSGQPSRGRSGGAAHAQAGCHGGKRTPADGGGEPEVRQRRRRGGSDRVKRSRQ